MGKRSRKRRRLDVDVVSVRSLVPKELLERLKHSEKRFDGWLDETLTDEGRAKLKRFEQGMFDNLFRGDSKPQLGSKVDLSSELERFAKIIEAMPPIAKGIVTHPLIPPGVYRQWDTDGDLWLWANSVWFKAMPIQTVRYDRLTGWTVGIPVYSQHPKYPISSVLKEGW